jgi:hypothetical protein
MLIDHGNAYGCGMNDYGQIGHPIEQTKMEVVPKIISTI